MVADTGLATVAVLGVSAYLVGGIPVGWLLARARHRGVDLRQVGTGKVGTSNIYRNLDAGLAAVVGPAQFLQGLLPVLVARALGQPDWVLVLVALCAVIGNGWPVYLGFNGGRGIAVATGAVAGISLIGLGVLLFWYAAGALTREIALGVLAGFLILPLAASLLAGPVPALGFTGLLIIILLRRMEGVREEVRAHGARRAVFARRLLRDERAPTPPDGERHVPPSGAETPHRG